MASEYCYSIEMKQAIERHERGEAHVIPVILRPVYCQSAPFGKLQALPKDARPVTSLLWHNLDEAFFNIAEGIRKIVKELVANAKDTLSPLDLLPSWQPEHVIPQQSLVEEEIKSSQPNSCFLFNEPLTDLNEFYGRKREQTILLTRTRNRASTSIVGPRRIGKTWLVEYLRLVAPAKLGSRFHIGYLDATLPSSATSAGFTAKALEQLGISTFRNNHAHSMTDLEEGVRALRQINHIPILCIDEFEGFTRKQDFDLEFFTNLRAITQIGLSLVVISKQPIIDIVSNRARTSPFFNIFEQLMLKPFQYEEAQKFVHAKGIQAGFTDYEQHLLLQYGQIGKQQWSPIRLQLVGKMLLEDKNQQIYSPGNLDYWQEFEQRLEETYRAVVP